METTGYAEVIRPTPPQACTVITLVAPGGWSFVFAVRLDTQVQGTHYKAAIREQMKKLGWRTCTASFNDWQYVRGGCPSIADCYMTPREMRPRRPQMRVTA
jgi:glutathione S-transferase